MNHLGQFWACPDPEEERRRRIEETFARISRFTVPGLPRITPFVREAAVKKFEPRPIPRPKTRSELEIERLIREREAAFIWFGMSPEERIAAGEFFPFPSPFPPELIPEPIPPRLRGLGQITEPRTVLRAGEVAAVAWLGATLTKMWERNKRTGRPLSDDRIEQLIDILTIGFGGITAWNLFRGRV